MLRISAIAVTLCSIVCLANAEEYDLRGPAPVKGQVYLVTINSKGKDLQRNIMVMDRTIEETFSENSIREREIEVLGVDGQDITRMRTKVIRDVRDEIKRKGKRTVKESKERDLHGQYIYSERGKAGWKNSLEDALPTDDQKKSLKEYTPFKEEDIFYPAEKVKIGHEWKIGTELFQRVVGNQFDSVEATGTGKLVRVDKDGDDEIAIIEISYDLTGKDKEEDLTFVMKMKGTGTIERSLKHGFDRKSSTVVDIDMKGTGGANEQKLEVHFFGKMKVEDLVKLKK
jgi:hypothetical protein